MVLLISSPGLLEKPNYLLLSKSDIRDDNKFDKKIPSKLEYIEISSVKNKGIEKAKKIIFDRIQSI